MRARLQLLAKDQGGRHTPIFDEYRPRFAASTEGHGDVDLGVAVVRLTDNPMMMPGTIQAATPSATADTMIPIRCFMAKFLQHRPPRRRPVQQGAAHYYP